MIRIAHLSDIHFGGENAEAVAAAGQRISDAPPDLVLVSGDITRYAEVWEFEAAAAWLAGLPGEKLVTPGNHDAPYLAWMARIFTPFRRFEATFGAAWRQRFRSDSLAVAGLNTARGAQPRMNWSKGQIAPAHAREACEFLASTPDTTFRVVACHHPLMEMTGGPMTGKVWGGEAAARTFAEARIDLVLSGHIHAPFALAYPFADGRTYAVGAGTLSTRQRGAPAGYNEIEVDAHEIRIRALAFENGGFHNWRSWALERRGTHEGPSAPLLEAV